jgi:dCMP deaminase
MGYDRCICRHAEQAAIGEAARRGVSTNGAIMYSSLRPCMNCVKLALMCGISEMHYEETWDYMDRELEESYAVLARQFSVFKCVTK